MHLSARDLLAQLVSFPTVSRDSNLALIDFVETYLHSLGVTATRVPSPCGTKAGLFAHIGPDVPGGVVLSGHTDVVPVDGQDWSSDPFTLTDRDGKLYGRGACDMKGFDALALAAVPLALQRPLKRPLQIALSYDEEIGCTGAPPLIDRMIDSGMPRADTVIVGEPTMMQVVTGHKGGMGFDVHVRGFEVHSSIAYQGVSAVMEAAKLIDWANQMNAAGMAATPPQEARAFDPPYTSLHVGKITGGTAHNITARDCHFALTFRVVPGDNAEAWDTRFRDRVAAQEREMKAVRPEAAITLTPYFELPPLVPEQQGRAEELARRLTGDNGSHVVSYGTEAGHFQARDYSVVVCGPGDIAQAHQPDEYITCAQFDAGQAFMARLIDELAA